MDILPAKQNGFKTFLRRLKRYRIVFYLLAILIATFLIARGERIFNNVKFFPIRTVTLEAIDGSDPQYIKEEDMREPFDEILGRNFLSVNISEVSKKVKSESAFIKDLVVTKNFPGTVVISVVERLPVLIVQIDEATCAVLDYEAFVLDSAEFDQCEGLNKTYAVPLLFVGDSKVVFNTNEQSSFYVVRDVYRMILVLREYGYIPTTMTLEDQVLRITLEGDREVIFSLNQSVDTQLERLVAVASQLKLDDLDFGSLDLRYNRPVLKQK